MANKNLSLTFYQAHKQVSWPWGWKNLNNDNKCQKNRKFCQKMQKIRDENHSITTINYAVTYYQNLKELTWHLGPKKFKKTKIFKS